MQEAGVTHARKIEGDKYQSIIPSIPVAMDIVLEGIPDLCNISHSSSSFSAQNIAVLEVEERLSHS